MSTVALRGTLHREESSSSSSSKGEWQWRGMWAFGTSVSTAPAQAQQPFLYTFQGPTNPQDIKVPGILVEELQTADGNAVNHGDITGSRTQETPVKTEEIQMATTEDNPTATQEPRTTDDNQAERGDSKALVPDEKAAENAPIADTNKIISETATPVQDNSAGSKDHETAKAEPSGDATSLQVPMEKIETPTREEMEKEESQNEAENDAEARRPTYAQVPEGHPPFTDACVKYPDKPCPPSGNWKGYFQNAVKARPRERVEKVQENFYLFFNATPGPDVKYAFEDTPLPPTVHMENLVLVRGTGSNPFGTFEIIGYLDMTTGVVEIQRQYVLMPVKRRNRRSSTSGGSNTKSYSTRKRQPSWKRKALDVEDDPTPKRPRKRSKSVSISTSDVISSAGSGPNLGATAQSIPTAATAAVPSGEAQPIAGTNTAMGVHTPIPSQSLIPDVGSFLAPQGGLSTSGAKRPKTSRKRSGSMGSARSTASSSTGTAPTTSPYLKLPPVGEPKKARWRAAHFLYYQRNEQEDEEVKTPKYVVYEGEMVNSMREGRGVCLYSNGLLYEGQWKRNKEHGQGQLWTADRRRLIYEGSWERGRMQGHGTYYYGSGKATTATGASAVPPSGGARYIGEFKENTRHGVGQYILPDGSEYHGFWNQGKMNGRGVFTWPDLSVYDGEFKDGERHGQGILKTSDGFSYDGTWVQNAMEGRGIARYPNGQSFEGMFSNGRREGRGTIHFTNGAVYEGRFRDDAVDGQGTMKVSRSLEVPSSRGDERSESNDSNGDAKKSDFMIPLFFQSDMTHIHAKAGFTAIGD